MSLQQWRLYARTRETDRHVSLIRFIRFCTRDRHVAGANAFKTNGGPLPRILVNSSQSVLAVSCMFVRVSYGLNFPASLWLHLEAPTNAMSCVSQWSIMQVTQLIYAICLLKRCAHSAMLCWW